LQVFLDNNIHQLVNQTQDRYRLRLGEEPASLTAVHLRLGEYCKSRDARSIASGGIFLWNIFTQFRGVRMPGIFHTNIWKKRKL